MIAFYFNLFLMPAPTSKNLRFAKVGQTSPCPLQNLGFASVLGVLSAEDQEKYTTHGQNFGCPGVCDLILCIYITYTPGTQTFWPTVVIYYSINKTFFNSNKFFL